MTVLVLVDGPNLYNDVGRLLSPIAQDRGLTAGQVSVYFRQWFDIDRLVSATLAPDHSLDNWDDMGTVIFHSRKSLGGPKTPYAMQGDADTLDFWARQGSNSSTSTLLVDIPGSRQGSEKGIDTSIVVYMFETADRWDRVVLFTSDADFVPAVWSLRRRGKRVYCASQADDLSRPLVQACQHFLPVSTNFLLADIGLFQLVLAGSILDQFIDSMGLASSIQDILISEGYIQLRVPEKVAQSAGARLDPLLPAGLVAHSHGQAITIRVAKRVPSGHTEVPYTQHVYRGMIRHRNLYSDAKWHSLIKSI